MILLRPYQSHSVTLLRNSMAKGHKRIVLCLPTGSGKSVIFSELVRLTALRDKQCLVLTHRIEIFTSTLRHLDNSGITATELAAHTTDFDHTAKVIVAMVETLHRRQPSINPDLIIIDEAHFGNFTKILTTYPNAYIIGVTATPVGKHFAEYYTDIVNNIDIPELINGGHLVPCKAYQMQANVTNIPKKGIDYDEAALFKYYNTRDKYDGVVEQYLSLTPGTKAIVFNVNVEHTLKMTECFNKAGILAKCVHAKTSSREREQILLMYKNNEFPVLLNCGILVSGFDEPSIETVIMNLATLSLPKWLQCQGRGSRPFPGKTHFTVIDFGSNHNQHGLWQQPRRWTLKPASTRNAKKDAQPIKTCPTCAAVVPAQSLTCQYCGTDFPRKSQALLNGSPVLQELANRNPELAETFAGRQLRSLSVDELIIAQQENLISFGMVQRILRSHGRQAIQDYANKRGFKPGWVYMQTQKIKESQFKNVTL